jgi:hypothetical protein
MVGGRFGLRLTEGGFSQGAELAAVLLEFFADSDGFGFDRLGAFFELSAVS